jgi:heterodisulfide reductase subunit A
VESALALKKLKPEMDVFILYRDLRTYGEKELLYKEAREQGVMFIRFDLDSKPRVEQTADGTLKLTITDPILNRPVVLKPDLHRPGVCGAAQSGAGYRGNLQGAPERRRL